MGNERERKAPINSPKTGDAMAFLGLSKDFQNGGPEMLLQLKAQLAFVESDTLPAFMDEKSLIALDVAGVRFDKMVPDDPLFTFVTLPDGWSKTRTENRLVSKLLDHKERTRAVIFYKESFSATERKATLTALSRYSYEIDQEILKTGLVVAVIKDAGRIIDKTTPLPIEQSDAIERATEIAKELLDRACTGWQDPAAYWDES